MRFAVNWKVVILQFAGSVSRGKMAAAEAEEATRAAVASAMNDFIDASSDRKVKSEVTEMSVR